MQGEGVRFITITSQSSKILRGWRARMPVVLQLFGLAVYLAATSETGDAYDLDHPNQQSIESSS